MYNGKSIKNHNLSQLNKVTEFLRKSNALNGNINQSLTHNVIEEQQSQGDSGMLAQIQKMAQIAKQNKNKNKKQINVQNSINQTSIKHDSFNTQSSNNYLTNFNNSFTYKLNFEQSNAGYNNKPFVQESFGFHHEIGNSRQNVKSSKQRLSDYMSKNSCGHQNKHVSKNQFEEISYEDQEHSQQEQVHRYQLDKRQPKKKKNRKKQAAEKTKQQEQTYQIQNMIRQKDPNLFSIDKLKTEAPLTRNYKIGNKQEWENNKKIDDYKLTFVLRKFPRIKQYRNNQKAIIKCSLLGNDVFVCMPTGGGKSLTFQVMTFIQKGVYLCILPLVSLIIDQQEQAKKVGIKAFSLTGAKQIQDNRMIYQELSDYEPGNQSIVVFCTPQKVNKSPQFFNVLEQVYKKKALVKIVIDEVHCVSTWGKQFRHDYQNLSSLRQNFPNTPILGLTATVTQIIKQDIIKRLSIQNCFYFQSSFNRPNLHYEVRQKTKDTLNSIIKILSEYQNKSGIIYCISRKDCEQMCSQLKSKRFKVAFYHANISENDKREIQSQWMANRIQIIIATIAFGMGINKPDVRFVIHHSLSKSLENYYQESGRAGRDGDDAKCILFYRRGDKVSIQSLIMKNQISKDQNKNFCMKQLSNMIRYCEDKYTCRRKFQLDYLGEKDFNPQECNKTCDNCRKALQYIEVQCIKQAKYLVNFLMQFERTKQNISQNQIIMICKGVCQKKFKYKLDQIERSMDLSQLRSIFSKWSKLSIDELINQLCSYEVFYQKMFTTTFKNNTVSNFYIKVNYALANKFLQKVQTLAMKRSTKSKANTFNKEQSATEISDNELDFEEDVKMTDYQNQNVQCHFQEDRYYYKGD